MTVSVFNSLGSTTCRLRKGREGGNGDRTDEVQKVEEEALHEVHRLPASMGSSARRLRQEPFDESSARIFVRSEPLRKSEPFDELSARIFVRSDPRLCISLKVVHSRHSVAYHSLQEDK